MNREIMIVAGEASGDLHGSKLVRSIRELAPETTFYGMGGTEMQRAGVELLYDAAKVAVVGFFEVISHLSDIIKAQKTLRNTLSERRPSLLILIDLPDFNLLLARKAKKLDIPVFYYISPQVWAWRSDRVRTIAGLVKKIGVILPFEEQFYRERGVEAEYVGHPLLDTVGNKLSRNEFCDRYGLNYSSKIIGILPGSRSKEITKLLPLFLEAGVFLAEKNQAELQFLIPKAPTISENDLNEGVEPYKSRLNIQIITEDRYELMAACDVVAAASGTVTLELLLLDTPMVVAYRLSPLTFRLGRILVKIKYFSLVNLIAGKEIVPELLQDAATPEKIGELMNELLFDQEKAAEMKKEFTVVREMLGRPGASMKAAKLALSVINN